MTVADVVAAEHPCHLLGKTVLWRYMDLAKFINLVTTSTLYFPRLSRLQTDDPHEGTISQASASNIALARAKRNPGKTYRADEVAAWFNDFASNLYVNCWHANRESIAMWRLYAAGEGVAIKSSLGRIRRAIGDIDFDLVAGKVHYGNKLPRLPRDEFRAAFRKRLGYRFEDEARIAIFDESNGDTFRKVHVDLRELLTEIIISPLAPDYVGSSVRNIRQKWVPKVPMRSSTLLTPPSYSDADVSGR